MNLVIVSGRVGQEPKVSTFQSGTKCINFSVAVTRSYKSKDGEYLTDWIYCQAIGKIAETLEKRLEKGKKYLFTGSWQVDSYVDKDGNKVTANKLNVSSMEFIEPKSEKPTTYHHPEGDEYGFLEIPDGIDDEVPFK